jgi:site-specific DNA recombinase
LEREKLTELDNERIVKLDEDIERLIKQERALFLIEEKGYAVVPSRVFRKFISAW